MLTMGHLPTRPWHLDGLTMYAWENDAGAYITEPFTPFLLPSDWPDRPSPATPLMLDASWLFVRQHGATSLICPIEKGVIPAITVGHGTAAMHPHSRIPFVQVLLMLTMGHLPTRPWHLDGLTMYAWENDAGAYITEPFTPFLLPSDWPDRPSPATPLMLDASWLFVRQHGATSLICPIEKGVIPAITVGHGTAAMHPHSRIPFVQVLLMLTMGHLPTRPWHLDGLTMYAWENDAGAYITEPFTPFLLPSDWPDRPSPATPLMLDASWLFVRQHGATSLICPIEKGVIPAITVGHGTAAMHPHSRIPFVQVLLMLTMGHLPTRPWHLDGLTMYAWENDAGAYITEPFTPFLLPSDWPDRPSPATPLMLDASWLFVRQHGATSLICPIEKGVIPAITVGHGTAAMHPHSRIPFVQVLLMLTMGHLPTRPWHLDGLTMYAWENDAGAYITEPFTPFLLPSDWPDRPSPATPLMLDASWLFVRQHGATSLICPIEKGVIPAITVGHGTAAMHPHSRIPFVQVLLMLTMGHLPTRPWHLDGLTMYAWENDAGAYITEPFTPFLLPSDWPDRPSPATPLMLDASWLFVGQHGATSLICPIEKGAADAYDGASTHSTVASGWTYDVRLGERRWGLHHGTVYALPPAFRLAGSPFTGNTANAGCFVAVRRTTRGHVTYLPD
ncbi:hypothetical protein MTO96_023795 [Rhipicephalus appendiculatus]